MNMNGNELYGIEDYRKNFSLEELLETLGTKASWPSFETWLWRAEKKAASLADGSDEKNTLANIRKIYDNLKEAAENFSTPKEGAKAENFSMPKERAKAENFSMPEEKAKTENFLTPEDKQALCRSDTWKEITAYCPWEGESQNLLYGFCLLIEYLTELARHKIETDEKTYILQFLKARNLAPLLRTVKRGKGRYDMVCRNGARFCLTTYMGENRLAPDGVSSVSMDPDFGTLMVKNGRLQNLSAFSISRPDKNVVKALIWRNNYALLLENGTILHNFADGTPVYAALDVQIASEHMAWLTKDGEICSSRYGMIGRGSAFFALREGVLWKKETIGWGITAADPQTKAVTFFPIGIEDARILYAGDEAFLAQANDGSIDQFLWQPETGKITKELAVPAEQIEQVTKEQAGQIEQALCYGEDWYDLLFPKQKYCSLVKREGKWYFEKRDGQKK